MASPQRHAWPVVVTRPEREAAAWVQALAAQGFEPLALPLMGFDPPADLDALAHARHQVARFDAAMFVSPQAVHAFWQGNFEENRAPALAGEHLFAPHCDVFFPSDEWRKSALRCWAPGPGTARALVQWGVPSERIDQPPANAAQFDSEALWPVVQAQLQPGKRVLLVRGDSGPPRAGVTAGTGRDWLARQCEAAGAEVQFCVAYRRGSPVWTASQRALAESALARQAVWLLSSSESVGYLKQLLPEQNWQSARALATHPRIAASATALGFGHVSQSRPDMGEVLRTLGHLEGGHPSP